ncbi:hypothetical protein ABPG74_014975 [Tetrahymena malaccensis]
MNENHNNFIKDKNTKIKKKSQLIVNCFLQQQSSLIQKINIHLSTNINYLAIVKLSNQLSQGLLTTNTINPLLFQKIQADQIFNPSLAKSNIKNFNILNDSIFEQIDKPYPSSFKRNLFKTKDRRKDKNSHNLIKEYINQNKQKQLNLKEEAYRLQKAGEINQEKIQQQQYQDDLILIEEGQETKNKVKLKFPSQQMYRSMLEAANEIYAEYISSGENIMEVAKKPTLLKLKDVIESVKKEHFGITSNQQANAILFSDKDTISYANIHSEDDERFSFGLFFIPKGGFLPLHDHPNMFVFSKILMGKVKRLSFTLTNRNIQFDYPQNIVLQKLFFQQQQQQLLLQQRQLLAQKQQQAQLQQQNGQYISINQSNEKTNINYSNNNLINQNGFNPTPTQINTNQKKNQTSQLAKAQINDLNGQRLTSIQNEASAKNDYINQNLILQQQQQQQQQSQIQNMNNQNNGIQKILNNIANSQKGGSNNNSFDMNGFNGYSNDAKTQSGQFYSSPNLSEQQERINSSGNIQINTNLNGNISNQNANLMGSSSQSNVNGSSYNNSQQQQAQQQQQSQQQARSEKKIPEYMNLMQQQQIVEAILDSEEILSEGFIDDLDPLHKNLHYIEAVEDCVFFDVLLPHYDLKKRYCNYYNILKTPDPQTGKTLLSISNQPSNQNKVQYFTIEKSTCDYFN